MSKIATNGARTACGAIISSQVQSTLHIEGKRVICKGDPLSHGGQVIRGSSLLFAEGKPVARMGDLCICEKHGLVKIRQGSFVEDRS